MGFVNWVLGFFINSLLGSVIFKGNRCLFCLKKFGLNGILIVIFIFWLSESLFFDFIWSILILL